MDRTLYFYEICETISAEAGEASASAESHSSTSQFMIYANALIKQLAFLGEALHMPPLYGLPNRAVDPLLHNVLPLGSAQTSVHSAARYSIEPIARSLLEKCHKALKQLETLVEPYNDKDIATSTLLIGHRHGVLSSFYMALQRFTHRLEEVEKLKLQRQSRRRQCFAPTQPLPRLPQPQLAHKSEKQSTFSTQTVALSYSVESDTRSPEDSKTATNEQLLKETQQLLPIYENDNDLLRETQFKIHEIAELINTFSLKVAEQSEMCESVSLLADQSVDNLTEAKTHLIKAVEKKKQYSWEMILLFLIMSFILLVFDFLKSSTWY